MLPRVLRLVTVSAVLVALPGCPADPAAVPPGSSDVGHTPDVGTAPDSGPMCSNSSDCPICQKCLDGACIPQVEGDDMKDECPVLPCATGTCDGNSACGMKPATEVCRPTTGDCDVAESCTGTDPECPPDILATAVICRASAGGCDLAESCTGDSAACPADSFSTSDVVCRVSAGDCDLAESCTGDSAACPTDSFAASDVACRPAAGDCDVAESCTGAGTACPDDTLVAADIVCRPNAGPCDVPERCTGLSPACPPDEFDEIPDLICRSAAGDCDVPEICTGTSAACPDDVLLAADTLCRASAGDCDLAESCTGDSAACPPDTVLAATTVCRAAAGACDSTETCTGTTPTCPADAKQPADTVCGPSSCSVATFQPAPVCDGLGTCGTKPSVDCGDYFCNVDGCETSCSSNARCTTGFCDSRDTTMRCVSAAKIRGFDCSTNHSALRTEIEGCPATEPCYLKPITSAPCNPIYVANKDVFVTGALISPESFNYGGPGVTVVEGSGQITRFAMSDSIIRGCLDKLDPTLGTLPNGFGLMASRTGTGFPEVTLDNVSIGTSSFPNARGGIAASATQLKLRNLTVRNSLSAPGLFAMTSDVTIERSAFLANPLGGIELQNCHFTIESSAITGNGYTTPAAPGVTIRSTPTGARHVFRYNTVAENAGGMACSSEPTSSKTIIDASLFWNPDGYDNSGCEVSSTSDVPLAETQADPLCAGVICTSPARCVSGSCVVSSTSPTADACANGLAQPSLLVTTGTPTLLSTSPCIDKVPCDPAGEQLFDFLGQARPFGTACDVGAVEYQP